MEEKTDKIATRKTWNNLPIDAPEKIIIELKFSQEQYNKIKRGLIPHEMEDKWFIFFEDNWLYFHRSWTGYGIYKAEIKKDNGNYCIYEFFVERNKEKYKCEDDNEDIDNFTFLIAWGLLDVDVREIFFRNNINNEKETIKSWSNFGNLFISKKDIERHEIQKEETMKDYYRVILGKNSFMADECYNAGFIGVGFNREEDLTDYLFDDVKEFNSFFIPRYLEKRPEKDRQQAIKSSTSLWTFSKKIKIGDIVLSPKNVEECYVGIVTSDYYFENGAELPNRRNVKWYNKTIDKKSMSSELATSVWLIGTVHSLNKYVEELEKLIIE